MSIKTKQRINLEKLMKNIDKPVHIPEPSKDRKPPQPPEYVRNVMGSSAGAGSAEFHLYRNLRKRDMIREDIMKNQIKKETKEKEFQENLEKINKEKETKRTKKRAKRLKLKAKIKERKKNINHIKEIRLISTENIVHFQQDNESDKFPNNELHHIKTPSQ